MTAKFAAQIAPHVELSEDASALLTKDQAPGAYLDALVEAGLHMDAIQFLAHGLGRREGVWWACVCVRATLEEPPPADVLQVLAAAEGWCYDPTDTQRRAARDLAEAQGNDHPASWAGMAAFFAGDNLAPPEAGVVVAPGPFMTAKTVAGAVIGSAVRREPGRAQERYADFLARGIDIANGGWGNQPAGG